MRSDDELEYENSVVGIVHGVRLDEAVESGDLIRGNRFASLTDDDELEYEDVDDDWDDDDDDWDDDDDDDWDDDDEDDEDDD